MHHTTDATFLTDLQQSGRPVLVDFWAPWCGPCRAMAPILDEIDNDPSAGVAILKLDVDQNPGMAQHYRVRGIPTLLLLDNKGNVLGQIIGAVSKQHLLAWLKEHVPG